VVMLRGENPSLTFGTRFMYFNSMGEPANLTWNLKTISMSYEQWKTYSQKHYLDTLQRDARATVEVSVRAYIRE